MCFGFGGFVWVGFFVCLGGVEREMKWVEAPFKEKRLGLSVCSASWSLVMFSIRLKKRGGEDPFFFLLRRGRCVVRSFQHLGVLGELNAMMSGAWLVPAQVGICVAAVQLLLQILERGSGESHTGSSVWDQQTRTCEAETMSPGCRAELAPLQH